MPNDNSSTPNADDSSRFSSNDLVTHNELKACLGEIEAKVETKMTTYQASIDSLINKSIGQFKFWLISVGVAIVASIVGILLTVNQTQDSAYMAGYETRVSQKAFVQEIIKQKSSDDKKIVNEVEELKNQINLLIKLQSKGK